MPSSILVGVVYDPATLAILRVILPHDDADLRSNKHLRYGEAMAIGLRAHGTGDDAARALVRIATGREPPA